DWRASGLEVGPQAPSFTSATPREVHERQDAPCGPFFVLRAGAVAGVGAWRDYPRSIDDAHFPGGSRSRLASRRLPHALCAPAADAGGPDGDRTARRDRPD